VRSVLKVVVDTNVWIRALLGGPVSLPVLRAWRDGRFQVVISPPLLEELDEVWQRPRLSKHISAADATELMEQLRWRGLLVAPTTIPPRCRDIKDNPVLATAIDGRATAIVSGDADLRSDEELRSAMLPHGVEIWGVATLLARLEERGDP
jgi:putative PIN family toxin of toxin-antitoxin system